MSATVRLPGGRRARALIAVVAALAVVSTAFAGATASTAVTWSGEVQLTSTPATDGTQLSYDLNSVDQVENFSINVTGTVATEQDTETGSGLAPTESSSINIAGTLDPTGWQGSEPTVTVTGHSNTSKHFTTEEQNDVILQGNTSFQHNSPPDTISTIHFDIDSQTDGLVDRTYDVYIVEEGIDSTYAEGTKVVDNWTVASDLYDDDRATVNLPTTYDASGASVVTVEFVHQGTGSSGYKLDVELTGSNTSHDGSLKQRGVLMRLNGSPIDVSVSTASDSATVGDLAAGGSQTVTLDLSTSDITLSFSGEGGTIDYTLQYTERAETLDPTIEVNGHQTAYDGTLTNGTTQSLATDTSWIENGTNMINVTTAEHSADAPTPTVEVNYSHVAKANQSVDYTAGRWAEQYNVSRTFASAQNDAQLTIPFQGEVFEVTKAEMRLNGSGWSDLATSYYSLDGTELTIDLGDIDADTKVEVRSGGALVDPFNGSIEVLEPTTPEDTELDSRFKVIDPGANFSVDVSSGTAARLHYIHDESWSGNDSAVVTSNGGQTIYMPNAVDGGEAYVSKLDLNVSPATGDVRLQVEAAGQTPELQVWPEDSEGDTVEFKWFATTSGVEYELYSQTNGLVRDDAVAQSPVTLVDDDSNEVLVIRADTNSSSSSGGGGGGGDGGGGFFAGGGSLLSNPLTQAFLAGGAALVLFYLYRRFWPGAGSGSGSESGSTSLRSLPARIVRQAVSNPLVMGLVGVVMTGVLVVSNAPEEGVIIFGVGSLLLLGVPFARRVVGLDRKWALVAAGIVGVLAFVTVAPDVSDTFVEVAGPMGVLALLLLGGWWIRNRDSSSGGGGGGGSTRTVNLNIRSDDDG